MMNEKFVNRLTQGRVVATGGIEECSALARISLFKSF